MFQKVLLALSGAVALLSCVLAGAQEVNVNVEDSNSVLARLANVEIAIKDLQDENKKLRLENQEFVERLIQAEAVCQSRNFQLLSFRKRLKTAEKEILTLKRRDSKRRNNRVQEKGDLNESGIKSESQDDRKVHNSGEMKKPKIISPVDVTSGSRSSSRPKRLLLPVSTSTATSFKGSRIAFSAHANNHLLGLGISQKFQFDTVNDNEGGAYDQQTGVFMCPVAGTYHFDVTIMSYPSERIDSAIMVNGSLKSRLLSQGSSGAYEQSSNSLNIHLNEGDHVWVQHAGQGTKVHGSLYSHFGGFILWAD